MHVTFAEYLFYRALLQKRPIILRSLLIAASPKNECNSLPYASEHNRKLALFEIPRINMFFHVLVFPNVCLGSQRLMRQTHKSGSLSACNFELLMSRLLKIIGLFYKRAL